MKQEKGSKERAEAVSLIVRDMLNRADLDRPTIASRMSAMNGRVVSRHMLDAWASPARRAHNIPAYSVPILETACGLHALTDWIAAQQGGQVNYGEAALKAELIALEAAQRQADERIARLAAALRGGDHEV